MVKNDLPESSGLSKILCNGLGRSFASLKRLNIRLSLSYQRSGAALDHPGMIKHANEVYQCHRDTLFAIMGHKCKVVRAFTCQDRFCPICGFEKSRKVYSAILSNIKDCDDQGINKDHQFAFVGLTVRNVPGCMLRETVEKMSYAFRELSRRKAFKQISYGSIRTFEVTYNTVTHTFHPHIHVLVSLKDGYFDRKTGIYLTRDKLLEEWRYVFQDQKITQVDIRKVKAGDEKDLLKSIAEVAKYPLKMSSVFKLDDHEFDQVILDLYSLKGVRFIQGNGVFRHILHFVSKEDDLLPLESTDLTENLETDGYTFIRISEKKLLRFPACGVTWVRCTWKSFFEDPVLRIGSSPHEVCPDTSGYEYHISGYDFDKLLADPETVIYKVS